MRNSSDTIGNRTRDLPTCSAVPQPIAPPRAPRWSVVMIQIFGLGYLFLLRWAWHVACVVGKRDECILHPTITPY